MCLAKMPRVYVSAPMRSGSSLISGILNGNSKIKILDNFHLERFIIGKNETLTKKILHFKIEEMTARLNLRYGIKVNKKNVIDNLKNKTKISYTDLYDQLILDQLNQISSIKIIGEDAPMSWRFIEKFIKMYKKNAKVIHIIRDPRSIFASWKKATYQKVNYWGVIFNLIDNMIYAKYLKKKLNKKNYILVKFEDVLKYPNKYAKIFSNFLNIKLEKSMTSPKSWPKIFEKKGIPLGWSSIGNRDVKGFYKNRINIWKKHLNKGEIFIIEMFMQKYLIENNYQLSKISEKHNDVSKELIKFLRCMNESKYLEDATTKFLKNEEGTYEFAENPVDPNTWGGGRKNKIKFISTPQGKKYIRILNSLKKKYL